MHEIDNYLAKLEPEQRTELQRIRTFVKQHVPDATEGISYGLPAFKYKAKPLVYFGAFKNHMSLFPTSGPTDALKEALQRYTVTKGTIQFTLDNPLPDALLLEILQIRMRAIDQT